MDQQLARSLLKMSKKVAMLLKLTNFNEITNCVESWLLYVHERGSFFQGQILVKQHVRSVRTKITIFTRRVRSMDCPLVRDKILGSTDLPFKNVLKNWTVSHPKSSGMSFPVYLIIHCYCKETIDSDLVYCILLAGHDMGDPFEISTIRREVSMLVLLMHLEVGITFTWTSSVIFDVIFCHQFDYDFQEMDNLERCGGPDGLDIIFYVIDFFVALKRT